MNIDHHLIITGGTGYIGGRLLGAARKKNWRVTVLSRRRPAFTATDDDVRWFPWALGDSPPAEAFEAARNFPMADGIIHLAHHWRADVGGYNINLAGTRRLIEAARKQGIGRFIFGSSVSARPDALNAYGRIKWEIEQLLTGPEQIAARIGLVYGGSRRGQWGTLLGIVRKMSVLPMVAADRKVQPIHIDDVCRALLQLIAVDKPPRRTVCFADPDPIGFGEFLKILARDGFGKSLMILPMPVGPTLTAMKALKGTGLLPSGSDERILGLAGLTTIESRDDLKALGIELMPLAAGLAGIFRRRRVALEGHVLLRYLTGARPTTALLRRYVRGIERFHTGHPLKIPALVQQWPTLVGIYEPLGTDHGTCNDLSGRLHVSVALADAMLPGPMGTYDYAGEGWVKAVINIFWQSAVETILLPLRAIFGGRIR